jgi:hypothetical protein
MSITVQLSTTLAADIQEKARNQGISLEDFIAKTLTLAIQKPVNKAKPTEEQLLEKINLGISENVWREYKELKLQRKAETLDTKQVARLIELSDKIESANARRVKYLVQLSQLKKVPLRQLMTELGIEQPDYE